jgi:uncharacterized protein DUF6894
MLMFDRAKVVLRLRTLHSYGVGFRVPPHCYVLSVMARYFFDVHFDHAVRRDCAGLELPNLDKAVMEANQARAQIMAEDNLKQLRIEIVDQEGRVLATVG